MRKLCTYIALASLCLSLSAQASVLDPESVGELVESATLNFASPKGVWRSVPEACPALEEAKGQGVSARELPSWLRGKGLMVLASCRVSDAGGDAAAPERFLLVQDVAHPEVLVLVPVSEDGGWTHAAYQRFTDDAQGAPPPFWFWKIDRVERFPE